MPDGYDSHADYMGWVKTDADARASEVRETLIRAFSKFVEIRSVEIINFSAMTALDLAAAIQNEPSILKPLMACCNVAMVSWDNSVSAGWNRSAFLRS